MQDAIIIAGVEMPVGLQQRSHLLGTMRVFHSVLIHFCLFVSESFAAIIVFSILSQESKQLQQKPESKKQDTNMQEML